jgi:predicted transcriptional regulator
MLSCLDEKEPRCVKGVAESLGISEEVSCKNLQILESGGFLEQERVSNFLFYSLLHEDELLQVVLDGLKMDAKGFPETIYMLTAMTHERRIRIVTVLKKETLGFSKLGFRSGISLRALERQFGKLERRGFIYRLGGRCRMVEPKNKLARKLIELA